MRISGNDAQKRGRVSEKITEMGPGREKKDRWTERGVKGIGAGPRTSKLAEGGS